MTIDLKGGKIDLLTKSDLKYLEKNGLIVYMFTVTDYVENNFPHYEVRKGNNYSRLFGTYNNRKNKIVVCDVNVSSIDYNIKVSDHETIGVVPVIRYKNGIPGDIIRNKGKFRNSSDFEIAKIGRFLYSDLSLPEEDCLEKKYQEGNVIPTGAEYREYKEYIIDGEYYARNEENGKWARTKDVEWLLDFKNSVLICTNILSVSSVNAFEAWLEVLTDMIFQERKNIDKSNILLTVNEENNLPPFSIPTMEMLDPKTRIKLFQYKGIDIEPTEFAYLTGGEKSIEHHILHSYKDKVLYEHLLDHTIRPCINYDYIKDKSKLISSSSIFDVVSYGEYPTSFAGEISDKLEYMYIAGELNKTNKSYHFLRYDGKYYKSTEFEIEECPEYEYKGNKYIRLDWDIDSSVINNIEFYLKRKFNTIQNKGIIWIKVEDIKWLVDKETNAAIAEKGLLDLRRHSYSTVDLSLVNNYLKKYFSKDIEPSKTQNKKEEVNNAPDNIMLQIIMKKYNLIHEKERIEKIKKVIEGNEILQRLMEKNNLTPEDVELDESDNPLVRGLKI